MSQPGENPPAPATAAADACDPYGDAAYWETRYAADSAPFEWLLCYSDARDALKTALSDCSGGRALELGCGTSSLGADLLADGTVAEITCSDVSRSAIAAMQQQQQTSSKKPKFAVLDCLAAALPFADGSLDAVLDKCTLDSLLCGPDSQARAKAYVAQAHRVLRPGGILVVISWRPPEARAAYLQNCPLPEGASGWTAAEPVALPKPDLSTGLLAQASPKAAQQGKIWLYALKKN